MNTVFISIYDLNETGHLTDDYLVSESGYEDLILINSEEYSLYLRFDYEDRGDLKDVVSTLTHLLVELCIPNFQIRIDET